MRKYSPDRSMGDIRADVDNGNYVFSCNYTDDRGIRKLIRCHNDLIKVGVSVEIYEHERLCELQLLKNLVNTYKEIDAETEAEMDAEAEDD